MSMNVRRHSADNVTQAGHFCLNVPVAGMEQRILKIGASSGRDVDKIDAFNIPICQPGWAALPPASPGAAAAGSSEMRTMQTQYAKLLALRANLRANHDVTNELLESATLSAFVRDTDAQLARLKSLLEAQFTMTTTETTTTFALADCVAHMVVRVVSYREWDGHYVFDCSIERAYVRADYWSGGKLFCPTEPTTPPFLTFLGSQTFGYVRTSAGTKDHPDSASVVSAMYPASSDSSSMAAKPRRSLLAPAAADHNLARIGACVLKVDHFEAIYRLPKVFEGAPNYREVAHFPVFGTGQPTVAGFRSILEHVRARGFAKFVWICMRQEPVLYANDFSLAPRALDNLNENMEFDNVNADMIERLQDALVHKYRRAGKRSGHVEYYKDTYAENPADRRNFQLQEPVEDGARNIRTLTDVFAWLRAPDGGGYSVESVKVPIADERAPSPVDFDIMISLLRSAGGDTAALFNCQMGKGRTTTGMVCGVLIYRCLHGGDGGGDDDGDDTAEVRDCKDDVDYELARELVAKLGASGARVRHEVDDAIDRADHMQNLRQCIEYTRVMYEKEVGERRDFWKRMSRNFMERYYYLICFNAYLHTTNGDLDESTFSEWILGDDGAALVDGLDAKLDQFQWQP